MGEEQVHDVSAAWTDGETTLEPGDVCVARDHDGEDVLVVYRHTSYSSAGSPSLHCRQLVNTDTTEPYNLRSYNRLLGENTERLVEQAHDRAFRPDRVRRYEAPRRRRRT